MTILVYRPLIIFTIMSNYLGVNTMVMIQEFVYFNKEITIWLNETIKFKKIVYITLYRGEVI